MQAEFKVQDGFGVQAGLGCRLGWDAGYMGVQTEMQAVGRQAGAGGGAGCSRSQQEPAGGRQATNKASLSAPSAAKECNNSGLQGRRGGFSGVAAGGTGAAGSASPRPRRYAGTHDGVTPAHRGTHGVRGRRVWRRGARGRRHMVRILLNLRQPPPQGTAPPPAPPPPRPSLCHSGPPGSPSAATHHLPLMVIFWCAGQAGR